MEIRDLDMEIPREPRRRLKKQSGFDPEKKSLILGAAGALFVSVLVWIFLGGSGNNAVGEMDAVKSRLDGLERRLALIEEVDTKISSSETRTKRLQASVNRLESLTRAMKKQMERLEKAPSPTKPVQSTGPASVERRLHEVRPGESLFSIAKDYGMSVDELRRLNHLSRSIIQPGQRLIVKAGT